MLEGLGPMELLMILVIIIVLFGAKRVPEVGASIGKGIRSFKRAVSGLDDPPDPIAPPAGAAPRDVAPTESDLETRTPKRLL